MFNLLKFFNPSYLFQMLPLPLSQNWKWIAIVVLGVMLIAAVVIYFLGRRKHLDIFAQRVSRKLTGLLATMSVIGWMLLFFRQYRVYFLSTRFLTLLWILGLLWWAWWILRYVRKKVSLGRLQASQEAVFEKYLPRKKK